MKFKDLQGNIIAKDIAPYKRQGDRVGASKGEKKLGEELDRLFPGFVYQEFPCFGTRMRLDFYVHFMKLAFEFDGEQHDEYIPHFHKSKRKFQESQKRDWEKEDWCRINNIRLIRVSYKNLNKLKELISERNV